MKQIIALLCLLTVVCTSALAQTNPVPQTLPYSEDFSSLLSTSTIYPAGWQGWTVATSLPSSATAFATNAPLSDRSLIASGSASGNAGNVYNYSGKIGFLTTGSLDLSLVLGLNTTSKSNVQVSYDVMTIRNPYDGISNTRINEVTLQYRVGTTGSFTNLTGIEYQNNTTLQTGSGVTTPQNSQARSITLPALCDNQPVVQLRWISRQVSGGGGRPSFAVDNINVTISTSTTPTITVSPSSLTGFSTTAGSASASQSISVSGSNLTDNITITPSSPYELSLDNVDFFPSLMLTQSSGTVNNTTVYVRINAGASSGAANGTVLLIAGTATNSVSLSGIVNPAIVVNPPQSFSALAVSSSEIDLTSTANAASDNVVIAFNTANVFGTPPVPPLPPGSTIPGGGTILVSGGPAGSFVHTGLTAGTTYYYSIWSIDGASNYSSPLTTNATTNAGPPPNVVVNQVYGGGGNSGAVYKNDFIELFNNENFSVSLSGWSVQYQSSSGTGTWSTTALNGTIPPHGFYLVQELAGTGGTTNLPTPDATGTIAMGATAGKVILSNVTTALTGANPTGITVIDKVGYGSANGFETAPAAAPDNTSSVQRIVDGVDNNNNSTDFKVAAPVPRNSSYTISAPVITSFSPPNNSLNVPYNIIPTIIFDKPIRKGTGLITFFENGVPAITVDVTSPGVVITNTTVTISTTLSSGKSYYVLIDAGAFKDVYANNFAGVSNSTTWTFTTYNSSVAVTIPITFDFQNCSGTGLLPDGFTQFSVTGNTVWDCTPFGRDPSAPTGTAMFPNAVQINGFSNGTNISNIDWLISPALNLTGTNYPLLSFWSRTAFNGQPLQLKISTDYVSGDPMLATWTDLNGKFPAQTSNTWTLSSNVNLSAFKQSNVHFAFVYTSTNEDGARWTVDDIQLDNSATPPPPSLTIGTTDIQFNFVASGSTGDKTFTFIGNDLTDDVTLFSTGAFLISRDGVNFDSQLAYNAEEANNLVETVYVRFSPNQPEQNFTGLVSVTTGDLSATISLKGSSIDPATTLEVVNWNLEWFGSTDPSLGPTNDDLQEQNVRTVLQNANADIYGLVEVVDESRLANIVNQMPGYSYVICNYGSHTNPFEPGASPISEAQKEAFVYKTSMFSNISTTALCTNGVNTAADLSNPAYNYFSSGRYPFMMTADVTMNGITKQIRFVLLHAKANTSPTATAYARRKAGADTLKFTLNTLYPNDNILMLGDFNDDLDSTITDGIHPRITSYYAFTHDTVTTYFSPTLALSLAGKRSTVSFNDMIDHVMLSNELKPYYMPTTANVLTDAAALVNKYGTTTSDHFPVFTRYMFCKLSCPENISVSNDAGQCGAVVNFNISSSMTCGTVTAVPASGSFFPVGTTPVQVTTSTGETCSFTVTVTDHENPTISVPANVEVNSDSGQCYATVASLGTPVTNDNCGVQAATNDAPANLQFPIGVSTVIWTVTDIYGNSSPATQTITVTDNERPTIVCVTNQTKNTNTNQCSYTVSGAEFDATANDNCNGVAISNDYNHSSSLAGAMFNKGQTTVIWTATDAAGNTATCSFEITVEDHQAPSITAPSAVNIAPNNAGCTAITPALGSPVTSDNCPAATVTNNAPTIFQLGTTIVTWTVTDASGNSATATQNVTVEVSPPIVSSVNDEYAVSPGGSANTIYVGYGPSSLTLHGNVTGGGGSYFYKWTIGSSAGPPLNNTSSYTVSPVTNTTYYFNVKDQFGCSAPVVTKTINVVDVRCGPKNDKVTVCQLLKGKQNTNCLAANNVAAALAGGAYLGPCVNTITRAAASPETTSPLLTLTAAPNPSGSYFTVTIRGTGPEKLRLRVTDVMGRIIEQKENLQPNTSFRIGNNYHSGVYIVEVIQGNTRRQLKLIKRN